MVDEYLDEVADNISILIREELETHHRLEGHPTPVDECPVCQWHNRQVASG